MNGYCVVFFHFQIFSNEHIFKIYFKVKCKIKRKGPVNENEGDAADVLQTNAHCSKAGRAGKPPSLAAFTLL